MGHVKILTAVTIPTGGWDVKVYLTTEGGVNYDKPMTMTMAAGTYYLSADNQADDFYREFMRAFKVAALALAGDFSAGVPWSTLGNIWVLAGLDENGTRKSRLYFRNPNIDAGDDPVKLAWTELDGGEVAAALGFSAAADDVFAWNSFEGVLVGDYQPGYTWVAEEDGWLAHLGLTDTPEPKALQSTTDSGRVSTQLVAERYTNTLELQHVTRRLTLSDDVGYGEESVYPYARNKPLQCWWREAIQGVPFRVYRNAPDADVFTSPGPLTGMGGVPLVHTGGSATTFETSAILLVDPQQHKGKIIRSQEVRHFITSHTATVVTVPLAPVDGEDLDTVLGSTAWIMDETYRTYVLDLEKMRQFKPKEVGRTDRFDIEIPLRRYVP